MDETSIRERLREAANVPGPDPRIPAPIVRRVHRRVAFLAGSAVVAVVLAAVVAVAGTHVLIDARKVKPAHRTPPQHRAQVTLISSAGALVVVNPDGSGREQLAASGFGLGQGFLPVAWSPDGSTLVAWKYGLYVMRADGTDVRFLGPGGNARWSPDGRTILTESFTDPFPIDVVKADGTGRRHLTDGYDPSWSPDGKSVLFRRDDGIYVIHADGTQMRRLTPDAPGAWYMAPTWSPSGAQIAFVETGRTFVMRADGSASTLLADTAAVVDLNQSCAWSSPSWSPDGSKIAFVSDGGMYIARNDGSQQIRLVGHACDDPSWSPDGSRIAYVDEGASFSDSGLYVARSDGTGRARLIVGTLAALSWSPDGSWIVFSSGGGGGLIDSVGSSGSDVRGLGFFDVKSSLLLWRPVGA